MLNAVTPSALEMTGTAVFRIVVSSDSMKNATATSHGRTRLIEIGGDAAIVTKRLALDGGYVLCIPSRGHPLWSGKLGAPSYRRTALGTYPTRAGRVSRPQLRLGEQHRHGQA